jgi:hypothetical protein
MLRKKMLPVPNVGYFVTKKNDWDWLGLEIIPSIATIHNPIHSQPLIS